MACCRQTTLDHRLPYKQVYIERTPCIRDGWRLRGLPLSTLGYSQLHSFLPFYHPRTSFYTLPPTKEKLLIVNTDMHCRIKNNNRYAKDTAADMLQTFLLLSSTISSNYYSTYILRSQELLKVEK